MTSILRVILRPIKTARRLAELERRLSHARVMLQDDRQWLAHDRVSLELTTRYREALLESWATVSFEPIQDLRKRLDLHPEWERGAA